MNYLIHNASRSRQTRTVRSKRPVHQGLKQYMFKEQRRLIRGRPLRVTEDELALNLDEIRKKAEEGLIYVTLENGAPFDLGKLVVTVPQPIVKRPSFLLDSINNDKPAGIAASRYGDAPPPAQFTMPVELPAAAIEDPVVAEPVPEELEPEPVVVEAEPEEVVVKPKPASNTPSDPPPTKRHFHKRRNR